MAGTRRARFGTDLTIANGQTRSSILTNQFFGDAEGVTFFVPDLGFPMSVHVSYIEAPTTEWFVLYSGITPLSNIATTGTVAITVMPPACFAISIVSGTAVAGAKTIQVVKAWRAI